MPTCNDVCQGVSTAQGRIDRLNDILDILFTILQFVTQFLVCVDLSRIS